MTIACCLMVMCLVVMKFLKRIEEHVDLQYHLAAFGWRTVMKHEAYLLETTILHTRIDSRTMV